MSNNYTHRIVSDIDDTILFTTNRDWENASPNLQLIKKLNSLYDKGWEICYYTARGSLSCKTRKDAEEKYLEGIKKYFEKHNIKYTEISFNKPFAQYYIDDKAIKPEDFLNLDIEPLLNGKSGAKVERHGNKVYKTDNNSLNVALWYKKASEYIPTINIHSVVGNTICMDYIEKTAEPTIKQIDEYLRIFKNVSPVSSGKFEQYIKRIANHLSLYNNTYSQYILNLLNQYHYRDYFNTQSSFCHGDFSLDNMINQNNVLYLIDPIYEQDMYSSYLLDVAKIIQSARLNNNETILNYFTKKYKKNMFEISLLELTMWIRMRKYVIDDLSLLTEVNYNIDTMLQYIKTYKGV